MTTLLALYRRPDGGPEALATFERRYADGAPAARRRHARAPRDDRVQRVDEALGGETDLVLVTAMTFDDRAALDAGLGLGRDARRRPQPARDRARAWRRCSCSRTRRTWTRGALPRPWILSTTPRSAA